MLQHLSTTCLCTWRWGEQEATTSNAACHVPIASVLVVTPASCGRHGCCAAICERALATDQRKPSHQLDPFRKKTNQKFVQERQRLCTRQVDAVAQRLTAFVSLTADAFGAHVTRQALVTRQNTTNDGAGHASCASTIVFGKSSTHMYPPQPGLVPLRPPNVVFTCISDRSLHPANNVPLIVIGCRSQGHFCCQSIFSMDSALLSDTTFGVNDQQSRRRTSSR